MKLYLIRHGESANNALESSGAGEQGRSPDPELTATGHRQAELVAAHLIEPRGEPQKHPHLRDEPHRHGFGLTHVYCSLMTRSILTARYIADACDLPLTAHPEIFERGGIYEIADDGTRHGRPGPGRSYFETRFPELQVPDSVMDEGWYDRPHETEEVFIERTRGALHDLHERHASSDDNVALVVHGDFIDQFVNEVSAAPRQARNYANHWAGNWAMHNTSLTRIDFVSGGAVVVYTNRLGHLPAELVTW